jgi:class 3 adenylate cyclase
MKPKNSRFKTRQEYEQWKKERFRQNTEKQLKQKGHIFLYYKTVIVLTQLLFYCTIAVIPLVFLPFIVSRFETLASYPLIETFLDIEEALTSFISAIIPIRFFQIDWSPWIIVIMAYFLGKWFSVQKLRYNSKMTQLEVQTEFDALKRTMNLSGETKVFDPIRQKLESFKSSDKHGREELLKIFAETKKKLDKMGRDLSFLSIDVVDSTGMKQGEEKALIEYTFREYKKFVEEKLSSHGALKSAWTPDGVMICFPTVDAAVRTARDIIKGLDAFNEHVKSIKQDIKVRCGINSGYVYFDESVPMEEMSDRVIDIAGHMQKYASPNNIFIAKPAIEPTYESEGFTPASKIVDGYEVYVWGENQH